MESQRKKDEYKQMLLQVMQQHADDETIAIPESQEELQKESSKKEDFYDFRSDDEGSSCIEVEANEYLSNAKIIECLHKYPTIKTVSYVQYCLPSSAPVERLFSLGGAVLTPKRNRLTDVRFEKLLLMCYNKDFLDI